MRVLAAVALLVLGLTVSSALAKNKKPVLKKEEVKACYLIEQAQATKGYEKVKILLEVPVSEDEEPLMVAKRATFIFALHFPPALIKHVSSEWVIGMMTCRRDYLAPNGSFFRAGPVWFRMRTIVGTIKEQSYVLETYLWLPVGVIKSKPRAETRLNNDIGYSGEWTVGESIELNLRPRLPDG